MKPPADDSDLGSANATFSFLSLGLATATVSLLIDSRAQRFAQILFASSIAFGMLALLKFANSVALRLSKRPQAIICWGHAMIFEFLLAVFIIPWTKVLRLRKSYRAPTSNSSGRPILFVHGYCNDSSVWVYIKSKLTKKKLGPLYVIDLGSPHHSLIDHARKLKAKCAQIELETGSEKLILIGHSMGGVVAALCALDSSNIAAVITIASPLAGTKIAKLGKGLNAREMEIDSALMKELALKMNAETAIPFFHIATKTDQMIIPSASSLRGVDCNREFVFQDIGHKSLLFSRRTAHILANWLTLLQN